MRGHEPCQATSTIKIILGSITRTFSMGRSVLRLGVKAELDHGPHGACKGGFAKLSHQLGKLGPKEGQREAVGD
jgi:hypothetical protein